MFSKFLLIFIFVISLDPDGFVHGKEAFDGQFPSMVALIDLELNFVASGNLLTYSHILSSAKCYAAGRTLMALAGDVSISRTHKPNRQFRSIINISIHPKYEKTSNSEYDLAIVMTSTPFKLCSYVRPIKFCSNPPTMKAECFAVGWGLVEEQIISPTANWIWNLQNFSLIRHFFVTPSSDGPIHSNTLLYHAVGIVSSGECNNITGRICIQRLQNISTRIEPGSPLICNQQLCGLSRTDKNGNLSTISYIDPKKFENWMRKELSSTRYSFQFIKRNYSIPARLHYIWLLSIGLLKIVAYFI